MSEKKSPPPGKGSKPLVAERAFVPQNAPVTPPKPPPKPKK
jgi:hypothetical protein